MFKINSLSVPRVWRAAPKSSPPRLALDTFSSGPSIYTAPRPLTPVVTSRLEPAALKAFPHADAAPPSDGNMHTVDFTYDADGRTDLTHLTLVGSWDNNTGHYSTQWNNSAIPMTRDDKGVWHAQVNVLDDASHPWQWGVQADGPSGKQQWAIFEENNLTFEPQGPQSKVSYAPTQLNRMGMTHSGDDVAFQYWAPYAKNVQVRVWGDDAGKFQLLSMAQDPQTGKWSASLPGGWAALNGKNYAYQVDTQQGATVLRSDPYGRDRQGQQVGIGELYLSTRTGQEVTSFFSDPQQQQKNLPSYNQYTRFEVQGHTDATDVSVTLRDDSGHVLTKDELAARLGATDTSLISHYHNDNLNDFYQNSIDAQGNIHLVKQGGAWGVLMNNPQALAGLHYRITVKNGDQVLGDTDGDGQLSAEEARHTAFNDPYSDVITGNYGWDRYNVIKDDTFNWQNDNVPRMATDRSKMVIYQLHVGSFMGDSQNVHHSNFNDVVQRLQYLKDLGVNTLEMLPVNAFEGERDWGYVGTNSLGVANQYGFEDKDGRWVSGREALCRLIDAAHGMGFNVYNDVVYNHWGGNANDMWNTDGTQNPYFNWNTDPNGPVSLVNGQFGALPAYNNTQVRQFIVDSAMQQFDDLHFDDVRFDFTHPIHDDNGGGGLAGWTLLRRINREIHFFHPGDMTNAEEFPNGNVIAEPAGGNLTGGAGFDTQWDTEFQHDDVHNNGFPAGALQSAANGWQTNMDAVMNQMVNHPGFDNYTNGITIISDHDEVGNGDRTVNVAMQDQPYALPTQWARDSSRTAFGVGMLAPGLPLFFQGEESLAKNKFQWDVGSTWDMGWDWLKVGQDWDWSKVDFNDAKRQQMDAILTGQAPATGLSSSDQQVLSYLQGLPPDQRTQGEYNIMRHCHYNFCKDVTHLRTSTPAFDGDASVQRVYTHNQNSVMAYTRQKGNDEYLVVASYNKNDLNNYTIPTPDGQWQLVLDSDAPQYGGNGVGTASTQVAGNQGTQFNIPAGGMLVYKKVG